MIHFFKNSIATIKLPDKFTYPFHYTPHPLCIIATKEVNPNGKKNCNKEKCLVS